MPSDAPRRHRHREQRMSAHPNLQRLLEKREREGGERKTSHEAAVDHRCLRENTREGAAFTVHREFTDSTAIDKVASKTSSR